ncbi:hypothetical protein ACFFRR_008182 [Megaselia abdita]
MDEVKKNIAEEYQSSLQDLNLNSKPLINMLTILAEENINHANVIVDVVEEHILKVAPDVKLPILYLIDSIVKNVKSNYVTLFSHKIVNIFCGVFEKVNEKIREKMFALRQTWNEVFPTQKLYALDVKVNVLDTNWPITAKVVPKTTIHVNPNHPNFHNNPNFRSPNIDSSNAEVAKTISEKQRELLELQKRKLELELEETKQKIHQQEMNLVGGPMQASRMPGPGVRGHFPNQYRGPVQRPPNAIQAPPPHTNFPNQNMNKPRINPVNPSMLSLRQRDPRLARQQQQQQQQVQAPPTKPVAPAPIPNLMEVSVPESVIRRERAKSIDERSKRTDSRSKSVDERQKNRSTSSRREREKTDRSERSGSESGSKSSPTRSSRSSSHGKSSSRRDRDDKNRSPDKKKSSSKSKTSRSDGSGDEKGSPTKFKDVKSSSIKNRNYMRKNVSLGEEDSPKSQDVDLRSLEPSPEKRLKLTTIPEVEPNGVVKDLVNNNNSVNIVEEDLKKRSLTDALSGSGENQPSPKRVKNDKLVDDLFGSSDVDLRSTMAPIFKEDVILTSVEKDKVVNKKPSFEEIRAKLGKATKTSRPKDPIKKVIQIDINEDSQDGKDANMRTIISQAQEIVENENLDKEQINSLIQTVMQLNESNKLIEAKRRESLNSNEPEEKFNNNQQSALTRMRIPKKSKETVNDERTELKSILGSQDANVTEAKPIREKPAPITKRRPSKWSPVTPAWEEQNQPPVRHPWNNSNQRQPLQQHIIHPLPQPQQIHVPLQQANPQPFPWEQKLIFNNQSSLPLPPQPPQIIETLPQPCNSVNNPQEDVVRSITIDGASRETRMYGKTAVIFMDWDKPIELGFKPGMRRIWIDEMDPICLSFNNDYIPVNISGTTHLVKFGVPSRELYIGENWYECFFGGRQIQIPIDGKMHTLRVEGPPPQVNLGKVRQDLVIAKINMIIDAKCVIPVFLDAKPQAFTIDDEKHVIQFADNLKTALIDGDPINVSYGDLPKHIKVGEKKYFVRFGALPKNISPGSVHIRDMIYINDSPKEDPKSEDEAMKEPEPTAQPSLPIAQPSLPVNVDELLQKLISSGIINNQQPVSVKPTEKAPKEKEEEPPKDVRPPINVNPINFSKPETIKTRQQGIVDKLMFLGMQCSSCGLRYPPEQTIKYSQHLDWHFRQNRRERDLVRKAHSRKWYYGLSDWKQYEEIIDLEEPTKNYFEAQEDGNSGEFVDEGSNQRSNLSPPPSCPAGPDDVDKSCEVCHERFEQYYNEDLEEWHLKHAVKMDERFYHPLCYEDYKASLTLDESAIANISADDNAVDVEIKSEKYSPHKDNNNTVIDDDDDDDVIVVPIEEPSITEIPDDDDNDEYVPQSVPKDPSKTEDQTTVVDGDDDDALLHESMETDVVIQEKTIPFLDLDNFDESAMSPVVYSAVKIKEEPKEDDDVEEDDGFEDVGTVVLSAVEEITIESDSIDSNTITDLSPTVAPNEPTVTDTTSTIDGNTIASQNISSMNKIRINIAKPKTSASSNETSNADDTSNSNCNNSNNIPVLCSSGLNNIQTIVSLNNNSSSNNICSLSNNNKLNHSNDPTNNYAEANSGGDEYYFQHSSSSALTQPVEEEDSSLLFPPPVFKPEMQNIDFKKMPKTRIGSETSGLCSIM